MATSNYTQPINNSHGQSHSPNSNKNLYQTNAKSDTTRKYDDVNLSDLEQKINENIGSILGNSYRSSIIQTSFADFHLNSPIIFGKEESRSDQILGNSKRSLHQMKKRQKNLDDDTELSALRPSILPSSLDFSLKSTTDDLSNLDIRTDFETLSMQEGKRQAHEDSHESTNNLKEYFTHQHSYGLTDTNIGNDADASSTSLNISTNIQGINQSDTSQNTNDRNSNTSTPTYQHTSGRRTPLWITTMMKSDPNRPPSRQAIDSTTVDSHEIDNNSKHKDNVVEQATKLLETTRHFVSNNFNIGPLTTNSKSLDHDNRRNSGSNKLFDDNIKRSTLPTPEVHYNNLSDELQKKGRKRDYAKSIGSASIAVDGEAFINQIKTNIHLEDGAETGQTPDNNQSKTSGGISSSAFNGPRTILKNNAKLTQNSMSNEDENLGTPKLLLKYTTPSVGKPPVNFNDKQMSWEAVSEFDPLVNEPDSIHSQLASVGGNLSLDTILWPDTTPKIDKTSKVILSQENKTEKVGIPSESKELNSVAESIAFNQQLENVTSVLNTIEIPNRNIKIENTSLDNSMHRSTKTNELPPDFSVDTNNKDVVSTVPKITQDSKIEVSLVDQRTLRDTNDPTSTKQTNDNSDQTTGYLSLEEQIKAKIDMLNNLEISWRSSLPNQDDIFKESQFANDITNPFDTDTGSAVFHTPIGVNITLSNEEFGLQTENLEEILNKEEAKLAAEHASNDTVHGSETELINENNLSLINANISNYQGEDNKFSPNTYFNLKTEPLGNLTGKVDRQSERPLFGIDHDIVTPPAAPPATLLSGSGKRSLSSKENLDGTIHLASKTIPANSENDVKAATVNKMTLEPFDGDLDSNISEIDFQQRIDEKKLIDKIDKFLTGDSIMLDTEIINAKQHANYKDVADELHAIEHFDDGMLDYKEFVNATSGKPITYDPSKSELLVDRTYEHYGNKQIDSSQLLMTSGHSKFDKKVNLDFNNHRHEKNLGNGISNNDKYVITREQSVHNNENRHETLNTLGSRIDEILRSGGRISPAYDKRISSVDKTKDQHSYGDYPPTSLENSNFAIWKNKVRSILNDHDAELHNAHDTIVRVIPSPRTKPESSTSQDVTQNSNLYPEVVAPSTLYFPKPCCIGFRAVTNLTVHNVNKLWVQCILSLSYQTLNGQDYSQSVFEVKDRIILRPNGDEQMEVNFRPTNEGVHVGQFRLYYALATEPKTDFRSWPFVDVQTHGKAEYPRLEITSKDLSNNSLDFKVVAVDSRKSIPINIVNKGTTEIPLRLTIVASPSNSGYFTLGLNHLPERIINVEELSQPGTTVLSVLIPKQYGTQSNAMDYQTIWVHFTAPRWHSGELSPYEEFYARISCKLDSNFNDLESTTCFPSLEVKARIGIPRLHVPRSLQNINLSCPIGQQDSIEVPLMNAGSINSNVAIAVDGYRDSFTAIPKSLHLDTGETKCIRITFSPTSYVRRIEGRLILHCQPFGPDYELNLSGYTLKKRTDSEQINIQPSNTNFLLCNKSLVDWGCVNLQQTKEQILSLRNSSDSSLRLKMTIKDEQYFALRNSITYENYGSKDPYFSIKPKENYHVRIAFIPNAIKFFRSELLITCMESNTDYQIPLQGYGGTSQIGLLGVRELADGYFAKLDELSANRLSVVRFTITNTGDRAAFVKLIGYDDEQKTRISGLDRLVIIPDEFVIADNAEKNIVVRFTPNPEDIARCKRGITLMTTIVAYTGDEICRQRYIRCISLSKNLVESTENANDQNFIATFNKNYQGERQTDEISEYDVAVNDYNISKLNLQEKAISLIASSTVGDDYISKFHSISNLSSKQSSEPEISLQNINPVNQPSVMAKQNTNPVSQPSPSIEKIKHDAIPETVSLEEKILSAEKDDLLMQQNEKSSWTLDPEQIILTAPTVDNFKNIARLQMANLSNRTLKYEMIWPAHYLTVTPESGTISPKSHLMILVSTRPSLATTTFDLPWCGILYVVCDGAQKAIRIQIRETTNISLDDEKMSTRPPISGRRTKFGIVHNEKNTTTVADRVLDFPNTIIGNVSETNFHISNSSTIPLKWNLTSLTPAYIKENKTEEVYRTGHTAFNFSNIYGILDRHDSITVKVRFAPNEIGCYSQFWDLETQPREFTGISEKPTKTRVHLKGECIRRIKERKISLRYRDYLKSDDAKVSSESIKLNQEQILTTIQQKQDEPTRDMKETLNDEKSSESHKRKNIYFKEEKVVFPKTLIGKSSTIKVKLCNSAKVPHIVTVLTPPIPFSVRHHSFTIKPRHYIRLPITYAPTRANSESKCFLVITTASNETVNLQLFGSA
ncbi:Centrosomal protein of 192 kDa [Trichoplax sp. H2]|nr:Centrosomal protein of 192 kDa [Trichoplax sp. H2]|eukprot:RDD44115.1 Centrosomal protein of 192 kDa [Trichoplax sp. H2]